MGAGVWMALGARPAQVVRLVLGRSVAFTLLGIALGLAVAAAVTTSMAANSASTSCAGEYTGS